MQLVRRRGARLGALLSKEPDMVALSCAVGRNRREPTLVPAARLFDFGRVATPSPGSGPWAPPVPATCRVPVMLLGHRVHVSFGRPASAAPCCPTCGGLAHRGLRADPETNP